MAGKQNFLRILTKAVQEKRCVAVRNAGNSQLLIIEPHVIYLDCNSDIVIDFYQKPDPVRELISDGSWNTMAWRSIESVFWLDDAFSPRIKQGFSPKQDKYNRGLIAIVDNGKRSNVDAAVLGSIESSLDQFLASAPSLSRKH